MTDKKTIVEKRKSILPYSQSLEPIMRIKDNMVQPLAKIEKIDEAETQ